MRNAKFEIFKDKKEEFRFRLNAKNGETILASEGYTSKQNCENGIKSVQKNSLHHGRFEKSEAKNGKFYFVLKAGNGEVIGQSQMYSSKAGRDNGMLSVVTNASGAEVVVEA